MMQHLDSCQVSNFYPIDISESDDEAKCNHSNGSAPSQAEGIIVFLCPLATDDINQNKVPSYLSLYLCFIAHNAQSQDL